MPYLKSSSGEVFQSDRPEWHSDCENLGSGAAGKAAFREHVCKELRKIIKPNQKIYVSLVSVSRTGMSRVIKLHTVFKGEFRTITFSVAEVLDYKQMDGGIKVSGCGMDMGFQVVHALWPNGTRRPHGTRNGTPDRDGGYALRCEWI